jgi:hypothetical protein
MNLLALRQWTVEFLDTAKSEPVLLLKRNNLERGSLEVLPILSMESVNTPLGDINIVVSQNGKKETYSTRNVEEWPSLDMLVFRHFSVPPIFLPEDHEYKTWIPKQAQCVSHLDRDRVSLGQECERIVTSEKIQRKVFFHAMPAGSTLQDVCDWLNEHDLADKVLSVSTTGVDYPIFAILYTNVAKY